MFGKSFDKKVQDAAAAINAAGIGVRDLRAVINGKVVTLEGVADSLEAKGRAVAEFNKMVKTENTFNKIEVAAASGAPTAKPPLASPSAPGWTTGGETVHEVVPGDTLSALAKKYYGNGNLYMKIFEANRDILNDPNLIKVGQKLKIPK
ncbi:MAG: LysM peptidoglycan-binding domain-containing protein [Candidatus Aminicenantes bacterium]|nr:LysM peptidoglycan-binding domain-containing protein [Candidatus Aminicenantes bacterium]